MLLFAADGSLAARETQTGLQQFDYSDPFGSCYRRVVESVRGAVTRVSDGDGCDGGRNVLYEDLHLETVVTGVALLERRDDPFANAAGELAPGITAYDAVIVFGNFDLSPWLPVAPPPGAAQDRWWPEVR